LISFGRIWFGVCVLLLPLQHVSANMWLDQQYSRAADAEDIPSTFIQELVSWLQFATSCVPQCS